MMDQDEPLTDDSITIHGPSNTAIVMGDTNAYVVDVDIPNGTDTTVSEIVFAGGQTAYVITDVYLNYLLSCFDKLVANNPGKTDSEIYARFPMDSNCLVSAGADYEDYKRLAEYANQRGYQITVIIKEPGYYYQINQLRR